MFIIVAINNSSLMLADRKKRSVSRDVASCSAVQSRTSSLASESVSTKSTSSKPPVNGDVSSKKAKCQELSSNGRASSLDAVKSSSASEETSGTVAKVVERRKSELTLTIKCNQTTNTARDASSDENDDDDDDDDDVDADESSSSSSLSSSNSEDELESTTKRPLSSCAKSRMTPAKTANKKQQSADSDSSRGNSDTEVKRNTRPSSSVSAAGNGGKDGCQTPSKAVKRKKSMNSQTAGRKRRRSSSSNNKVGCKSALSVTNRITHIH